MSIIITKETVTDTNSFQNAIDKAALTNQELVVSKGVYVVGTIFLRSNLMMKLEKGAFILGSNAFEDYSVDVDLFTDAVENKRGRSLVYGDNVSNIKIYGDGVINGRGSLFTPQHPNHRERPFLFRLINCSDIMLDGITLVDSAAWCVHLMNCEDIIIRDVSITNRVNSNNDGIDIDSCRRCIIENCNIDSGDDAICLKSTVGSDCSDIKVSGCTITTNWAGFKIGTESVGDFYNIEFKDSIIYDCNGCAIKIVPVDGANVKNLVISDIKIINSTGPIFIANGERLRCYHEGMFKNEPGIIENVTISNVYGDSINAVGTTYKGEAWGNAMSCICISGTNSARLKNISLSDISIEMAGDCTQSEEREVPQMGTRYPEFHNFGVLPAWGVYVRNTDGIKLNNINLSLKKEDVREMTVKENCGEN